MANPRFVVTSLSRAVHEARHLYEKLYCTQGEMEDRIKRFYGASGEDQAPSPLEAN